MGANSALTPWYFSLPMGPWWAVSWLLTVTGRAGGNEEFGWCERRGGEMERGKPQLSMNPLSSSCNAKESDTDEANCPTAQSISR